MLALVAALAASAAVPDVNLVCEGRGTYPAAATTNAAVFGSNGSASAVATTTIKASSQEVMRVRLQGGAGTVKVARAMIPAVNGGGASGEFGVKNLSADERHISGQFGLNFLNKPKFVIDRSTGEIDVRGSFNFSFSGVCSVAPDETAERKF